MPHRGHRGPWLSRAQWRVQGSRPRPSPRYRRWPCPPHSFAFRIRSSERPPPLLRPLTEHRWRCPLASSPRRRDAWCSHRPPSGFLPDLRHRPSTTVLWSRPRLRGRSATRRRRISSSRRSARSILWSSRPCFGDPDRRPPVPTPRRGRPPSPRRRCTCRFTQAPRPELGPRPLRDDLSPRGTPLAARSWIGLRVRVRVRTTSGNCGPRWTPSWSRPAHKQLSPPMRAQLRA